MRQPERDRGRPGEGRPHNVIAAGDDNLILLPAAVTTADLAIRCMRCRHKLTARRSVWIGLGPECQKIMLALIVGAA